MSSTISKFGSFRGNCKYAFPLFHIFHIHRTLPIVFIVETAKKQYFKEVLDIEF